MICYDYATRFYATPCYICSYLYLYLYVYTLFGVHAQVSYHYDYYDYAAAVDLTTPQNIAQTAQTAQLATTTTFTASQAKSSWARVRTQR